MFSVTNQFVLLFGRQASHMFSSQFVTLSKQVTFMKEDDSWKEVWVYIPLFAQQNDDDLQSWNMVDCNPAIRLASYRGLTLNRPWSAIVYCYMLKIRSGVSL